MNEISRVIIFLRAAHLLSGYTNFSFEICGKDFKDTYTYTYILKLMYRNVHVKYLTFHKIAKLN